MENRIERTVGHLFGLVGGLLIVVGGLIAVAFGFANLLVGHVMAGAGALDEAVVLFVVGALVLLFAHLGVHAGKDRSVASGVLLVVLAVLGWAVLGLGTNVVALVGGLLALLAGVLYLIEPSQRGLSALASAG
ncbi:MAG: hypothetical protein ACREDE_07195 [Thermoplasmata archaeon]